MVLAGSSDRLISDWPRGISEGVYARSVDLKSLDGLLRID